MYISKNPAKSRPLSANVKRLMRLARASPQNAKVMKVGRQFSIRDLAYCGKQGSIFMEAASMGFPMSDFAPLFMTSQIAGIFAAVILRLLLFLIDGVFVGTGGEEEAAGEDGDQHP